MLTIFTIVLNGQPFIEWHLPVLRELSIPWQWRIVEGVAAPTNCTSWCRPLPERWHRDCVSVDGTHEYLRAIHCGNVRVTSRRSRPYDGKVGMVREALEGVDDGVVMQIDADEIWQAWQIEKIYELLICQLPATAARFNCRYWVGPSKLLTSRSGWARGDLEWLRAWRWGPGVEFERHEPPIVRGFGRCVSLETTEAMGLVFDHYAYHSPRQIEMKADYYGYDGLVDAWHRLQCTSGPVELERFFPWAVGATADDVAV
jgi:hypothetical protein